MSEELVKECPQKLSKELIEELYTTAYEFYRNGKYNDAIDFFRFLTLGDCTDRRFWIGLGACYQMLKSYSDALECYSVAAIQNPNDPYVHYYAAICTHLSGDTCKAITILDSAISVGNNVEQHKPLMNQLNCLRSTWSKGADHG